MKRKRLWFVIGLTTAACVAAGLLLVISMRSRAKESIETRYAEGDLSGTIAALTTPPPHRDATQRARAQFLIANCYRQLGLRREFAEAIDRMRATPEATDLLSLTLAMSKIQHGELNDAPPRLVDVLKSAGAPESDAWSVVIQGCFAAGRLDEAQQLLAKWRAQSDAPPSSASGELEYLTAVALNIAGRSDQAEAKLIATLEQHPQHELSWLALAELYARPPHVRFLHSERVLEHLAARFPHNPDVDVRLARVRRRLGKGEQSLSQLASAATPVKLLEKASLEFDLGDYQRSAATLQRLGLSTADDFRRLTDAAFELSLHSQGDTAAELTERVSWGATALALAGQLTTVRTIFEDAADRTARLRRLQDLTNQQTTEPAREELGQEMDKLVSLSTPFSGKALERFAAIDEQLAVEPRGLELYQVHCANCHGRSGRGDGRAACNLSPAPRNFHDEPLRLVSSENQVASDEDLAQIIRRGEPGTAMPAFERLSDADVAALVSVVRQMIRAGLRARYAQLLPAHSNEQASQWLAARTEPGKPLPIPDGTATAELAARGAERFRSAGCASCHALASQSSLSDTRLFDSLGRPVKAPRLDVDPFHGGDDATAIYRRIALGIPGTPHPALAAEPGDIESLVAYIRSIRLAEQR